MYEEVEKTKSNKVKAVANSITQQRSNNSATFQFFDNRPEVVAQRKMHNELKNKTTPNQLTHQRARVNDQANHHELIQKH